MATFIKLIVLEENKELPTLIDLADIHSFQKRDNGLRVFYKARDPEDGLMWTDDIKDTAGAISAALAAEGVKIITL